MASADGGCGDGHRSPRGDTSKTPRYQIQIGVGGYGITRVQEPELSLFRRLLNYFTL